MNIELLKKIKRAIVREPNTFRMDRWTCGTAHCIAGHACALSGYEPIDDRWAGSFEDKGGAEHDGEYLGARLLGLRAMTTRADKLFFVENWPEDLRDRYGRARTRRVRADIAAERIDRFIQSNGRQ